MYIYINTFYYLIKLKKANTFVSICKTLSVIMSPTAQQISQGTFWRLRFLLNCTNVLETAKTSIVLPPELLFCNSVTLTFVKKMN